MSTVRMSRTPGVGERGFTMVELMVAVTIAMFLLGGLLTMVQSTKNAFLAQSSLGQLQDSERLAMVMISDVVQAAGYYPNPLNTNAAAALPATQTFATAGQGFYGTTGNPTGDTLSVQYQTASGDGIINCVGQSNTDPLGNPHVYANQFSVDPVNGLECTLSTDGVPAAPVVLVAGVQSLAIWYGVKTDFTVQDERVDSYLRANEVAAGGYWPNVVCVRIQITFTNPLYKANNGQNPTVQFSRVVNVMNKAGVTT